ncbi:MAG TPA: 6,7-dimethyl-8-ribityllumazine synthase [Acidimicrobiia bacterium]|nr:6,7-dimethyl-8-ribityllumazine synthase [Acidimicrobiia bacterium]
MTEVRTVAGTGDAGALHIGVVVASWNRSVTDRLLDGAVKRLEDLGVGAVTVVPVPGSLELSVAARALAEAGCDAVVALGTIVKGETDHYAIVSAESARGLTLVALKMGVPVTNGVLAVHDVAHAVDRAQPGPGNKGYEAATAAVEAALTLRSLGGDPSK